MTTYNLRSASPAKTRADVVVVGVRKTAKGPALAAGAEDVAEAWGRRLRPMLVGLGVKGTAGEAVKIPTFGTINAPVVIFAGLGADATPEAIRRAAGVVARAVSNAASIALALPAQDAAEVRAVTEGFRLGGYTFTAYKSGKQEQDAPGTVSVLSPGARRQELVAAFEEAQVVADAVAATRDWVNTPPADLTPPVFAEQVAAAVRRLKLRQLDCEVLGVEELAELGCGGILGVGQGSAAPPRLVKVEYSPAEPVAHLALVGKGITFDSGGLSIKTAQGMTTMKCDMAGAATVIQATLAIARLGLPVRVTAYAPMAENMPSGSAIRPGDILTMRGGKTVEVTNTDAEGRLVLADALVLAGEQEPDQIIDVATLTGAMVVALGERVCGALGSPELVAQLLAAGEAAGEQHWEMPIPEDVVDRVRASKIADVLQADGARWGGGLYAAAFLREFTGDRAWAHLDIAGPAFVTGGASGYWTPGGTGFGVATLVDHARALAAGG